MLSFIVRRTLYAIPVLVGIVVVVFFLIRAIPGEPCTAILGEQATEEACERFNEANGLNEPILVQLGIYLKNVATFNLGDSIRFSRPVNQLLIERLPLTIELGLAALTIAIVVGVPMGVVAAASTTRPLIAPRWRSPTSVSPCRCFGSVSCWPTCLPSCSRTRRWRYPRRGASPRGCSRRRTTRPGVGNSRKGRRGPGSMSSSGTTTSSTR